MIYQTSFFTIYFGNASKAISLQEIVDQKKTFSLDFIGQQINAEQLLFLHQTHGVDGGMIKENEVSSSFFQESGDFLMTQKKNCGIGVVTADCLPIIMYDSVNHASSIIHAGWKGLVNDIFQIALESMVVNFASLKKNITIYLGPSAGPCCYEVKDDFINKFKKYPNYEKCFIKKNNKTFFDSRIFIIVIARSLGIEQEKIYTTYNVCTICDLSFCSYRREKDKALRQVTIISLH